jgi:hypothetical protein
MHTTLVRRIVESLFDCPVMQNNIRSIYVEHMVAELLGEGWKLTSGSWAGWDLGRARRHARGGEAVGGVPDLGGSVRAPASELRNQGPHRLLAA